MNPGNVNMANLATMGGPVGAAPMPMMNNGVVGPQQGGPRQQQQQQQPQQQQQQQQQQPDNQQRTLLNTYIYEYFIRYNMHDCARALVQGDHSVNVIRDGVKNGNDDAMDTDSKDDIESKLPDDLPPPRLPSSAEGTSFLYEWFCLFWEMYQAQRGRAGNPAVHQYVNHTQSQSRMKQQNQQELLRMRPDMAQQAHQYQMMRMQNPGVAMVGKQALARTAMANSHNNPQAVQMLQQAKQNQQMQRDPSDMDGNRQRQSSPGSTDNAPSPSKRPRLGESGFNPNQPGMRPVQGMPGQPGAAMPPNMQQAQQLLLQNGINPGQLSTAQLQQFSQQTPANQQKSIATYSANLGQHQSQQMPNKQMPNAGMPQGQGSPMMPPDPNNANLSAYYNPEMGGPGRMQGGPGAGQAGAGGSNHALQDYQMQLMLLEQQNKKRLMMARQEQDNMGGMPRGDGPAGPGGPGGPPGPNGQMMPEASPQGGARSGASPNPAEQMKRGTPQMSSGGMGSPLPADGSQRGSPNPMNFMGTEMNPTLAPHFFKDMNGGGNMVANGQMNGNMRPPSSHPNQPQQFNGQVNPQMMGGGRGQPGPQGQGNSGQQQVQWTQGGPNGNQMGQQGGQGQGQVQGTPQQRNSMPPPSGPAAAASNANNRTTSSPQATPQSTPSQSNKPAPKKKEAKGAKSKAAAQKKSNPNLNASTTPAAEPAQEAEATAPATPMTPSNPPGFKAGQGAAAGGAAGGVPVPSGQQPPTNATAAPSAPTAAPTAPVAQQSHTDPAQNGTFGMDSNAGMVDFSSMDFANPLTSGDVLNDFDFDSFLNDGDDANGTFDFNTGFSTMEGNEIGAE